jgi:hypothetical protein
VAHRVVGEQWAAVSGLGERLQSLQQQDGTAQQAMRGTAQQAGGGHLPPRLVSFGCVVWGKSSVVRGRWKAGGGHLPSKSG